jgi:hypothetical protein
MPDWFVSILSVVCAAAGFAGGYNLGFRNGCIRGELRALHLSMERMRSRRRHREHRDDASTSV